MDACSSLLTTHNYPRSPQVTPPMPRLEASLLHMPELCYEGELRCIEAAAVNEGSGPLRGVRVACLEEHTLLGASALVTRGATSSAGPGTESVHKVHQVRDRGLGGRARFDRC